MIATIAVGLQEQPSTASKTSYWASDYKLVGNASFTKAITAVSSIIFAYAGTPGQSNLIFSFPRTHWVMRLQQGSHWSLLKEMIYSNIKTPCANDCKPGFFPIAAEMRNPSLYTRSLLICQSAITAIYIAIGTVIYYYCGSYVASPALGSAGTLIKRVAYGIALPGLVASTVIVLHVSDKSG